MGVRATPESYLSEVAGGKKNNAPLHQWRRRTLKSPRHGLPRGTWHNPRTRTCSENAACSPYPRSQAITYGWIWVFTEVKSRRSGDHRRCAAYSRFHFSNAGFTLLAAVERDSPRSCVLHALNTSADSRLSQPLARTSQRRSMSCVDTSVFPSHSFLS